MVLKQPSVFGASKFISLHWAVPLGLLGVALILVLSRRLIKFHLTAFLLVTPIL